MRFAMLATVLLPFAVTAVAAQGDPIKERKALMKAMGDQADAAGAILKGQAPYDAAKATAIFKTFADGAAKFGGLFPAGSDTGDTKATAAVWKDRAGFDAELAKFQADIAANAGKVGTADGFKAAMMAVAGDCRSCHQTYQSR